MAHVKELPQALNTCHISPRDISALNGEICSEILHSPGMLVQFRLDAWHAEQPEVQTDPLLHSQSISW